MSMIKIQKLLVQYSENSTRNLLHSEDAQLIFHDVMLSYQYSQKFKRKQIFKALLQKIQKKKGYYSNGYPQQLSGTEVLFAYCYLENINPAKIYRKYLNHIKRNFKVLQRYERFCKKNNLFNVFSL